VKHTFRNHHWSSSSSGTSESSDEDNTVVQDEEEEFKEEDDPNTREDEMENVVRTPTEIGNNGSEQGTGLARAQVFSGKTGKNVDLFILRNLQRMLLLITGTRANAFVPFPCI
jgi:hypothetical protein